MFVKRLFVVVGAVTAAIATAAVGAIGAPGGTTAASSFELVFEGRHEPAADSPMGYWHVGKFTASGAFCSAGSATTLRVTGSTPADAEATRLLTCADGSGSATALVVSIDSEHGGSGAWRIVSGTGAHSRLRGRGVFRSVRTGGNPTDHGSITFRTSWTGIADRDDTPPAIAISQASAAKLRRLPGTYVVRIAFSAREESGNAVRYLIYVNGRGRFLASRLGETQSGKVSAAIRVRPALTVRRLHVEITAFDPLGNESKASRVVRLPR